jgi:hypothetical protein
MKKSIVRRAPADEVVLGLGKVLGQSVAFGIVAGRCSAAQAAALHKARSEKAYRRFGLTWKEFCPKHLRMSGTQADEIIRLLQEFGPEYFEHTESVHISADTYRLVAPFIQDKALRVEDEVLELNSANVQKVARSVRGSQRALPPPAEPEAEPEPAPAPAPAPEAPTAAPALPGRLDALYRHAMGVAAEFREVAKDCRKAGEDRTMFESMFRSTLILTYCELTRVGLENGVV